MNYSRLVRFAAVAGSAAVVVGAQVLAQVIGAAPASAVAGLEVVAPPATPFSSAPTKSVTATCPANKRVIGGGGRVNGAAGGKAFITQLKPHSSAGVNTFTATGTETDNGFGGNWSVQVFAYCANAAAVPGHSIVTSSNTKSSSEFQLHLAGCPAGQKVLGMGGQINDGFGQVSLNAMGTNNPDASFVSVAGYEDIDGFSGNWGLTTYAICGASPAGFKIKSAVSATNSDPFKKATATCDPGTTVHSSSFAINSSTGDVVLDVLTPNRTINPTTVEAQAREEVGTTQNWSVSAVAICAS